MSFVASTSYSLLYGELCAQSKVEVFTVWVALASHGEQVKMCEYSDDPFLFAVGVLATDFVLLWKTAVHDPSRCHLLQLPEQVRKTLCSFVHAAINLLQACMCLHRHPLHMCTPLCFKIKIFA